MDAPATIAVDVLNDCWNRIGVRGDGSCPELARHINCSNCPVHAAAALHLLDRSAPVDYLAECTHMAAEASAAARTNVASAVIFRIGGEWLALPTPVFREVIVLPRIRSLPHRQAGIVQGIANVRGELLICVSLAAVLNLELHGAHPAGRERSTPGRLVVIGGDGQRLGFGVDEMHGVHRYDPGTLQAVPSTVARAAATYSKAILSWQDRAVGLLDDELLLYTFNRSLT
jgi:chemotaxis-related protein WspD